MPRTLKYGPSAIKWIKANIKKVSQAEMAKHFNSTKGAFKRYLSKLRSEGYNIPHDRKPNYALPLGSKCTRISRGRTRIFEKTTRGWKDITNKGKERRKPGPKVARKPRKLKDRDNALEKSRLFVVPGIVDQEKTRIELPGGSFVVCDSDKVDKVIRYLQKTG